MGNGEVRSTHTEATEAKTGLVHVTRARRAVMETGDGSAYGIWLKDEMRYILEPAVTDSMT